MGLGLAKNDDVQRGYDYDVQEADRDTSHGGAAVNFDTTMTVWGY